MRATHTHTHSYVVGDTVPNTSEALASGAIRDVIAENCPRYNLLVNNSNPLVHFVEDPLGQSNRMSVRLSTKLDVLAQTIRTVATSLGVPTGLPVVVRLPRPVDTRCLEYDMAPRYSFWVESFSVLYVCSRCGLSHLS